MPTTQEATTSSDNGYEVGVAPPQAVIVLWPQIQAILRGPGKNMLEKYSEEEVLVYLHEQKWDLWCGMKDGVLEGFTICQWEIYSKKRYYNITMTCGKNLAKYFDIGMEKIEKYAMMNGAESVVLPDGRKGWLRMMARRGYVVTGITVKKTVKTLWRN